MQSFKFISVFMFVLGSFLQAKSNNISISNITSGSNSTGVYLQFDLGWENSWKNATNYDAAWVFFKFKDNDGNWYHLNLNNTNNSISGAYTLSVASDNIGAFIYRNTTSNGTVSLTSVRLGIDNLPGSFDVRGYAIEMVQVPSGSFYVGDNGSLIQKKYYTGTGAAPTNGFQITTATATSITVGNSSGNLVDSIAVSGIFYSAAFPTGYNQFYCMKYELSQGGFRDFLNTLSYSQQSNITLVSPNSAVGTRCLGSSNRNFIEVKTSGTNATVSAVYGCDASENNTFDESDDGEWVACNNISWPNMAAYLDWAGLRPMTELEYEKASRGTSSLGSYDLPTGESYTTLPDYEYTLADSGKTSEYLISLNVSTTSNSLYAGMQSANGFTGPMRNGAFANAYSTRISSGASYYGIMELAGNLNELVVSTGCVAGRSFRGNLGDGNVYPGNNPSYCGYANVPYWPGNGGGASGNNTLTSQNSSSSSPASGIAGITTKGGNWSTTSSPPMCLAYRYNPETAVTRSAYFGIRGVR